MELIAGLTVLAVGGLFAFVWNHPKAYDTMMPWAAGLALVATAFLVGLTTGFDAAVERLQPMLTADGMSKVDEIARSFRRPVSITALCTLCSFVLLPLLGGLKFLPRGKD